MSETIDLNRLVQTVRENQAAGVQDPTDRQRRIFVDRDAKLKLAENLGPDTDETQLSVVKQDTFHARRARKAQARKTAAEKMPPGTREAVTREGVRGWLYEFDNEFGDHFKMFAYRDGSYWQVLVIEPQLEDYYRSPHTGHIFGDGRICFGAGMQSGRRTLADAYAKSVLWSNGLSAMIHSGAKQFPFNFDD
jgi:hypothetical protein